MRESTRELTRVLVRDTVIDFRIFLIRYSFRMNLNRIICRFSDGSNIRNYSIIIRICYVRRNSFEFPFNNLNLIKNQIY